MNQSLRITEKSLVQYNKIAMSLDVYLYKNSDLSEWEAKRSASLKEAGSMVGLIPLIEGYYEDRKPTENEIIYNDNITHNLGLMAKAAGIYQHLWRPEEIGIKKASDLIEPLSEGLTKLKSDPEFFKTFDSDNGWGVYKDFLPFVESYLNACKENPDSKVEASR